VKLRTSAFRRTISSLQCNLARVIPLLSINNLGADKKPVLRPDRGSKAFKPLQLSAMLPDVLQKTAKTHRMSGKKEKAKMLTGHNREHGRNRNLEKTDNRENCKNVISTHWRKGSTGRGKVRLDTSHGKKPVGGQGEAA